MQTVKTGVDDIVFLGEILKEINPKNILLLTGKQSFEKSGAKKMILPYLKGYEYTQFSDFEENPKIIDVENILNNIISDCDFIIAVGGGSVIDMAKLINFFFSKKTPFPSRFDEALSKEDQIPMVAIPTTAGTGSEATHFAVVYSKGNKYSISDINLLPNFVFLLPELTYNNPKYLTAVTGIDAFAQALESFWSVNSTEESREMSKEAIELLLEHLPIAINNNLRKSRDKIMWASYLAGKCINITKTTAPHAVSYAFTSKFNIPHGHAVSLTLPYFVLYNSNVSKEDCNDYRGADYVNELLADFYKINGWKNSEVAKYKIEGFIKEIGLENSLYKLGVNKNDIGSILDAVNESRAKNNPRKLDKLDLSNYLISKI